MQTFLPQAGLLIPPPEAASMKFPGAGLQRGQFSAERAVVGFATKPFSGSDSSLLTREWVGGFAKMMKRKLRHSGARGEIREGPNGVLWKERNKPAAFWRLG